MSLPSILRELALERACQDRKWGSQRQQSPEKWHTILSEEVGECAEAVLMESPSEQRRELVQVGAVAVATIEAIDMAHRSPNPVPLVYLAGPIADCSDAEANGWRNAVTRTYPYVLNPMVRDFRGKSITGEDARLIVEGDKDDIDRCDYVIVWYSRPTVGTSMEILYAWERGKTVILVDSIDAGLSPWLIYHSTHIVRTIGEAVAIVNGGGK